MRDRAFHRAAHGTLQVWCGLPLYQLGRYSTPRRLTCTREEADSMIATNTERFLCRRCWELEYVGPFDLGPNPRYSLPVGHPHRLEEKP